MNKKLNLFIDFDEVLTDSIRSILLTLNPRYGTDFKPSDCTQWDFKDLFPDITPDEIEFIKFDNHRSNII